MHILLGLIHYLIFQTPDKFYLSKLGFKGGILNLFLVFSNALFLWGQTPGASGIATHTPTETHPQPSEYVFNCVKCTILIFFKNSTRDQTQPFLFCDRFTKLPRPALNL